jgi:hypothetical protein
MTRSDPVERARQHTRQKLAIKNGRLEKGTTAYVALPFSDAWEQPIPLTETPAGDSFPLATLPASLAHFVKAVALARNCPVDFAAVPLLVLAGSAIGASRALQIKPGWQERPCLYAAVIGPPGSAKTPALKAVAGPVYAEQSRRLASYKRQRTAWEEAGENGAPPQLETVYVSDVTVEKLGAVLQCNARGVVLIRDELTGWIGSLDQYRAKGKGADRQAYLSIWAGEPIRVDRKAEQEPVYVPHPFVGVIGGLPPDLLPRLRGDKNCWDGFLDRVLMSYPEPLLAKGEDWQCVEDEAAGAWQQALSSLWGLQGELTDNGEPRPRFVRLTADGRLAWERFTQALALEMNREDLSDPVKGHLAKFKGYCARLALIVHLLRFACGEADFEDVDDESLTRAGRLIDYFRSHMLKVHAALGADAEMKDAQTILSWISRKRPESFKRRDAHDALKTKTCFTRIEDLDKPMERLEKHGYIRRIEPAKSPGRPPGPIYEVNPKLEF